MPEDVADQRAVFAASSPRVPEFGERTGLKSRLGYLPIPEPGPLSLALKVVGPLSVLSPKDGWLVLGARPRLGGALYLNEAEPGAPYSTLH